MDQGCVAWLAQIAWHHYEHCDDLQLLRDTAWPLLNGAFNGYWAMLEWDDAGAGTLPLSVSPEYGAADANAWGANGSFQLAALHFIARTLPAAPDKLDEAADPRWQVVCDRVPIATIIDSDRGARIGIWRGQDLDMSHRHHSHLAAIYPFASFDPLDVGAKELISRTMWRWIERGSGEWCGWSFPAAAMIHTRCGNIDATANLLRVWSTAFTNEGRGSLINAAFEGISLHGPAAAFGAIGGAKAEIMQLEAVMGAVAAIQEMLVHWHNGEIRIMPRLPIRWQGLEFSGLCVPGAKVSASARRGQIQEVRIEATRDGEIRLRHGIANPVREGSSVPVPPILTVNVSGGEVVVARTST